MCDRNDTPKGKNINIYSLKEKLKGLQIETQCSKTTTTTTTKKKKKERKYIVSYNVKLERFRQNH